MDEIGEAFRKWRSNLKFGIMFVLGFAAFSVIFAIGVLKVTSYALPPGVLEGVAKGLGLGPFMTAVKIFAEVYVVVIAALLVTLFFIISGICGCGRILKTGVASFSDSMKCGARRYISYILAILAINAVSMLPALAYYFLHIPGIKPLIRIFMLAVMFLFIYVPYAIADGYGIFESFSVSVRCVRKDPLKTLIALIVCVAIGLVISFVFFVTVVPTALATIFTYRNPAELLAIYSAAAVILSLVIGYGNYLISMVVYATFLGISEGFGV